MKQNSKNQSARSFPIGTWKMPYGPDSSPYGYANAPVRGVSMAASKAVTGKKGGKK